MSGATRARSMLAVTIGVGPLYAEMAHLAAERVRRFTGLPTRVLGDVEYRAHVDPAIIEAVGAMASSALKTKLFELCPGFDDILFFDADLVFLAPWDPRTLADPERLVCVRDSWYLDFIQADAAALGVPVDRYFNTGFFIASREAHASVLAAAYQRLAATSGRGYRFHDQSLLNLVFHERALPLRFVDRRYDFLGWALDTQAPRLIPVLMAHCVRRHVRDGAKQSTIDALRGTLTLPRLRPRAIDHQTAAALAGAPMRLGFAGRPGAPVELRDDFTIGAGWTADVPFWMPLSGPRGPELVLFGRDFAIATLERGDDGVWRGRFPAGHDLPGGAPPTLAVGWSRPGLPVRLGRLARRTTQAALRAPLAKAALGRVIELRPAR